MAKKHNIYRIVLGKVGLDTHDRGMMIISRILREGGYEVILLGRFQSAETMVRVARDEGADIIGISDHCGVMPEIVEDVMNMMKKYKLEDIPVVVGGFVEEKDIERLEKMGVRAIFGTGSTKEDILNKLKIIIG
jgi:methylmalonyl-CoA mutase cobalamin-binding domain/chain